MIKNILIPNIPLTVIGIHEIAPDLKISITTCMFVMIILRSLVFIRLKRRREIDLSISESTLDSAVYGFDIPLNFWLWPDLNSNLFVLFR